MLRAFFKRRRLHGKRLKKVPCVNVFKLAFAALPTIAFGVFTIVFTLQQDASARATREQDQRQVDEQNRRVIFKDYIDDVKKILLDGAFENKTTKSLLQIRAQTLTALENLDPVRKRDVIVYLYENRLIRGDDRHLVDLRGANLNNVEFTKLAMDRCDLSYLYLPGIHAENIVFDACSLFSAVFNDASMPGARFVASLMSESSFVNVNLTGAHLHDNDLYASNFSDSDLFSSTIDGGVFDRIDLTNVNLYRSTISDSLLHSLADGGLVPNTFLNTRFPNGSFSAINSNGLIVESRAPADCHDNASLSWKISLSNRSIDLINASLIEQTEEHPVNASCFYRVNPENVTSNILSVQPFSFLIDEKQAMFNFSFFVGLRYPHEHDQFTVMIYFQLEGGSSNAKQSILESIKNPSLFKFHSIIKPIPIKTRLIILWLSCATDGKHEQFCLLDQLTFFIFQDWTRLN